MWRSRLDFPQLLSTCRRYWWNLWRLLWSTSEIFPDVKYWTFSEQTWSKRLLSIPYLRDEADPKETTTTSSLSFTSSVHYPDSQTSSLIDKPGKYSLDYTSSVWDERWYLDMVINWMLGDNMNSYCLTDDWDWCHLCHCGHGSTCSQIIHSYVTLLLSDDDVIIAHKAWYLTFNYCSSLLVRSWLQRMWWMLVDLSMPGWILCYN